MHYTQPDVYEFISKQTSDPIVEWKTCRISGTKFPIYQSDLDFYDKISPTFAGEKFQIPTPTLCPEERHKRRMAWRNERTLYKRKCHATEKQIISMYAPESSFTVYDQKERRGDSWDPLEYGQEINFERPFFEQFHDLMLRVPRVSIVNTNSENSEYTNYTANNKDCYLLFSNSYGQNEQCFYGTCFARSDHCIDGVQLFDCSYCYEVIDCTNCQGLKYASNCQDCSESRFLKDCIGCQNCIACYGLRNAQYYIFNKQYTKESYEEEKQRLGLDKRACIQDVQEKFTAYVAHKPHKTLEIQESEICSGNIIQGSKNCHFCYDTADSENCKYLWYSLGKDKDVYDSSYLVDSQRCYENLSLVHGYHDLFCNIVRRETSDLFYCDHCFYSKYCFGCIGLRHKQYCIFNKQYTKEEYETLVPKLIIHMQMTGERGEFFPIALSPFSYNETIAQEYFPLDQESVDELGYAWKSQEVTSDIGGMPAQNLSQTIEQIDEKICQQVVLCAATHKPFRILKQEYAMYKQLGIPLPIYHPDVRHSKRISKRGGMSMYLRTSDKSGEKMISMYPPETSFPVYSQEEYYESF